MRIISVNGSGTRFYGIHPDEKHQHKIATVWVSFLFLPFIPLARYRLSFEPAGFQGKTYKIIEKLPLNWSEIARTYVFGWFIFPLLMIGPALIFMLALTPEVGERLSLPQAIRWIFFALGILYLTISIWKISKWDDQRCFE